MKPKEEEREEEEGKTGNNPLSHKEDNINGFKHSFYNETNELIKSGGGNVTMYPSNHGVGTAGASNAVQ